MPLLSKIAFELKKIFFFRYIPKTHKILEIGSGNGDLGSFLIKNGWRNYKSLDLVNEVDYQGDIKEWKDLGIKRNSIDSIIAFELIEHVDCIDDLYEILKPGGLLLLTSPTPSFDWLCRILEDLSLCQKRSSPHINLQDFTQIERFLKVKTLKPLNIVQWCILRKPLIEKVEV
jgi:cyclopropane fatty-acyl-phospholipid synthase-like methyltransferase